MMKRFLPVLSVVLLAAALPVSAQSESTPAAQPTPSAPAAQAASNDGAAPSSPTAAPTIEADDLLKPPPLPPGKPSLIGGIVTKIDKVKETVVVRAFGGQNVRIFFDERTHIYRDGIETTMLGIRKGDRVYVDTLLDSRNIFAKNIRVQSEAQPADARGQIVAYDAKAGRMEMRDELSSQPVTFSVSGDTVVRHGSEKASLADLQPGSLIDVHFSPERAGRGIAREITIYATPGSEFVFAGKVTHLDMRRGILAVQNQTDNKSYEVLFDPASGHYENLGVGSEIMAKAVFDGARYTARAITVTQARARQ